MFGSASWGAARQPGGPFDFDVWNEPNGQVKLECLAHTACPYDANLTFSRFVDMYDRAFHVLRARTPSGRVLAPSLADGGPGNHGFYPSVLPWLQAFLTHAHSAGTLPDVLTWHVSAVGANASELAEHHAALKAWAAKVGIKTVSLLSTPWLTSG